MANTSAPRGLVPSRHMSGGTPRTSGIYSIASGYTSSIHEGDPVELTGTSMQIAKAAAGNVDNIGVFAGVEYTDSEGNRRYRNMWTASTAATDIVAFVYDDPYLLMEMQADSYAVTDAGALADWNLGTPNTSLGKSGAYLAVTGATSTTGKALKILGLVPRDDNAAGAYAKVLVSWAEHAYFGSASEGAGGV